MPSAENAAEFLILDRLFPRSIMFSVIRAENCLTDIDPRQERAGVSDQALRELGQIRSELEFQHPARMLDDLPAYMERIQERMSEVSEAIRQRYFPVLSAPTWVREDV